KLSPATPIPPTMSHLSQPRAAPPPAPPSLPVPGRKRRGWLIAVLALVIIVVTGSGLGTLYWLAHPAHPTPTLTANQSVGHVFLLSSGQVNELSSQGINDVLQI